MMFGTDGVAQDPLCGNSVPANTHVAPTDSYCIQDKHVLINFESSISDVGRCLACRWTGRRVLWAASLRN